MAEIKKHNKRAVKGKKRWRKNIDTADIEQNYVEQADKQFVQKNTKTLAFTIQEEPAVSKKQKLDAKRFFKKENINPSITEKKKLLKYEKKLLQKNQQNDQEITQEQNIDNEENQEQEEEFWGAGYEAAVPEQVKSNIEKKQQVSRVVIPHSGQSYNPSYKAHQNLIKEVIQNSSLVRENQKLVGKKGLSQKGLKQIKKMQQVMQLQKKKELQRKKFISKEEKLEFEQSQALKNQRKDDHSYNLIKKFKKEINQDFREKEQRQKEKELENQKIQELKQQGKVIKPEKLHRYKYKMQENDIVLEEDLPRNLRQIAAKDSDLVRESFDSIYRRGMLESRERMRNLNKRRVPLYKKHTVHSKKEKGDEWENIEKEMQLVN